MTARDEFKHDESEYALVGLHTGRRFRIGDRVKIRVMAANLTKRQLDYDLVEDLEQQPTSRPVNISKPKHKEKERGGQVAQEPGKKPKPQKPKSKPKAAANNAGKSAKAKPRSRKKEL